MAAIRAGLMTTACIDFHEGRNLHLSLRQISFVLVLACCFSYFSLVFVCLPNAPHYNNCLSSLHGEFKFVPSRTVKYPHIIVNFRQLQMTVQLYVLLCIASLSKLERLPKYLR